MAWLCHKTPAAAKSIHGARLCALCNAPIGAAEMSDSPLDDPGQAAHAWARYRRLMKAMALVTLTVVIGALGWFYLQGDDLPVHFYIATGLGISAAMLLTAALMGLVFLSSGTGHDEAVADLSAGEDER